MAESFAIQCASCKAVFVLPETYRRPLEGRAACCAGCSRWWVPVPAPSGPAVRLVKGRPERVKLDLGPFRRSSDGPSSAAPTATAGTPAAASPAATTPPGSPAAAAPAPGSGLTARVPLPSGAGTQCLRVVITVPGTDLHRKGVFDLGSKSFLIGHKGCHVNLPKASIPPRAVRIRAAPEGFRFEGVDGFRVPIGSLSIDSGQIERQGSVNLKLDPYEIRLETSSTPGRPIADLEPAGGSSQPSPLHGAAQPAVPPEAPQPEAPRPMPSSAPQAVPAAPGPPPLPAGLGLPRQPQYLQGGGPAPAADLRQQVQELAIEVREDQQAFDDQYNAVQEALDGDMTITDLGAQGFQASRFGNPLDGLEVSLVRADGPSQGQSFRITKSPLMIGRREGGMIINDRRVSSKHAQLDIAGARIYTLKDLASTNGTQINDRPISVGHLQDGDVISFGGVTFEFKAKQVK